MSMPARFRSSAHTTAGQRGPKKTGRRIRRTRPGLLRWAAVPLVVMIGVATASPSSASQDRARSREAYRLSPIGPPSTAPNGAVLGAAAPAVLVKDLDETHAVWRAGRTHGIRGRLAAPLQFSSGAVNGLGEVVGMEQVGSPQDAPYRLTRWSSAGAATSLGADDPTSWSEFGFLSDSGLIARSIQVPLEDSFREWKAVRLDRRGAATTVFSTHSGCEIADMSETGVMVGSCFGQWTPTGILLAGLSVELELPDYRGVRQCALRAISPAATYTVGECIFYSPDPSPPPAPAVGVWSLKTGKMVGRVSDVLIDVDDHARVLTSTGGSVSLWVNGKATPLRNLVRLTKDQSLLYPRFDAKSRLVAILSTAQAGRTIWQAVRIAPR